MLASPIRITACALLMALLAIVHPHTAQAQVAPRITIDSNPPGATIFVDGAQQAERTGSAIATGERPGRLSVAVPSKTPARKPTPSPCVLVSTARAAPLTCAPA